MQDKVNVGAAERGSETRFKLRYESISGLLREKEAQVCVHLVRELSFHIRAMMQIKNQKTFMRGELSAGSHDAHDRKCDDHERKPRGFGALAEDLVGDARQRRAKQIDHQHRSQQRNERTAHPVDWILRGQAPGET